MQEQRVSLGFALAPWCAVVHARASLWLDTRLVPWYEMVPSPLILTSTQGNSSLCLVLCRDTYSDRDRECVEDVALPGVVYTQDTPRVRLLEVLLVHLRLLGALWTKSWFLSGTHELMECVPLSLDCIAAPIAMSWTCWLTSLRHVRRRCPAYPRSIFSHRCGHAGAPSSLHPNETKVHSVCPRSLDDDCRSLQAMR